MIDDAALMAMLHDWVLAAEYDAGYAVFRCAVCGEESLLDPSGTP